MTEEGGLTNWQMFANTALPYLGLLFEETLSARDCHYRALSGKEMYSIFVFYQLYEHGEVATVFTFLQCLSFDFPPTSPFTEVSLLEFKWPEALMMTM